MSYTLLLLLLLLRILLLIRIITIPLTGDGYRKGASLRLREWRKQQQRVDQEVRKVYEQLAPLSPSPSSSYY